MPQGNPRGGQTYDKDDAELLGKCPAQAVLVVLVRGVGGRGCAVLCASDGALLLNEDIRDEAVDDRGADSRVAARPEHHPGRVDDFESVQHRGGQARRWPWRLVRWECREGGERRRVGESRNLFTSNLDRRQLLQRGMVPLPLWAVRWGPSIGATIDKQPRAVIGGIGPCVTHQGQRPAFRGLQAAAG